jgi:hypothetical protein
MPVWLTTVSPRYIAETAESLSAFITASSIFCPQTNVWQVGVFMFVRIDIGYPK